MLFRSLDTDTKRRIDTARDILVGKVPDPKSQVEQITIALIYKFMDDMDAEAEELGGKRKFFTKEFAKFVADCKPEETDAIPAIKTFFKAYVTSDQVRHIIDSKDFTVLATHPMFSTRDFRAVPAKYRAQVPEYVKDYVSLNQFAA